MKKDAFKNKDFELAGKLRDFEKLFLRENPKT